MGLPQDYLDFVTKEFNIFNATYQLHLTKTIQTKKIIIEILSQVEMVSEELEGQLRGIHGEYKLNEGENHLFALRPRSERAAQFQATAINMLNQYWTADIITILDSRVLLQPELKYMLDFATLDMQQRLMYPIKAEKVYNPAQKKMPGRWDSLRIPQVLTHAPNVDKKTSPSRFVIEGQALALHPKGVKHRQKIKLFKKQGNCCKKNCQRLIQEPLLPNHPLAK